MGAESSASMAQQKAGEAKGATADPATHALAESLEWLGLALKEKCKEDEQRATVLAIAIRNLMRDRAT